MGAGAPRCDGLTLSVVACAAARLGGLDLNGLLIGNFSHPFFAERTGEASQKRSMAASERTSAAPPIRHFVDLISPLAWR